MRLGDVANEGAQQYGKPLHGVRVLALEQMAAMPFATQLLARLGADVVKVEHPVHGESGRASSPSIADPAGRTVGATFLRSNFGKRSVGIDIRSDAGRELVLRLAPRFDVFAENFKAGTLDRLGLGYDAVSAVHPGVVYVSVSGFGADAGEYGDWPAYASIVEAMSGIYDFMRRPDERPRPNPVGALGDISTALFSVIGVLAALRHRDATGLGQRIDVAMYDATVAMTDIVANFQSLGWERQPSPPPYLIASFKAQRRLLRDADGARASVRALGRTARQAGVEDRPPVCRSHRLGRAQRRSDPPGNRSLGRVVDEARGRRRAVGGRPRGRSRPRRSRVGGGPASRAAQHARGDGPPDRRRPARARARQPDQDVARRRRPRNPSPLGRRAHRRGARRRNSAAPPTSWPAYAKTASSPNPSSRYPRGRPRHGRGFPRRLGAA